MTMMRRDYSPEDEIEEDPVEEAKRLLLELFYTPMEKLPDPTDKFAQMELARRLRMVDKEMIKRQIPPECVAAARSMIINEGP